MKPQRPPYRILLRWAATAAARGEAFRTAQRRATNMAALRRAFPSLLCTVLLGLCLRQLYFGCRVLPLGTWVTPEQIAMLADGTPIWVEGTSSVLDGTVLDPCSEHEVLSYCISITREIRNDRWDSVEHLIVPQVDRRTRVWERGVPWKLDGIEVRGWGLESAAGPAVSWRPGEPIDGDLARLPGVFDVRPGQKLQSIVMHRACLLDGEKVAAFATVQHDVRGRVWLGAPVVVLEGGYERWRGMVAAATVPWLLLSFLTGAMVVWSLRPVGRSSRRVEGDQPC